MRLRWMLGYLFIVAATISVPLTASAQRTEPIATEVAVATSQHPRLTDRTATSETFDYGNGMHVVDLYGAPVNFQDASGGWKRIDSTLIKSGQQIRNAAGPMIVTMADSSSANTQVTLQVGNKSVALGISDANPGRVAQIEKNTATYTDVFQRTAIRRQVFGSKFKESIILESKPANVRNYHLSLSLDGLHGVTKDDHSIAFQDDENHDVIRVEQGVMFDSGRHPSKGDVAITLSLDGSALDVVPDAAWINDPARVFPIVIDPTYDGSPTNDASHMDTFVNSFYPNNNYNSFYSSGSYVDQTGYDAYPLGENHTYFYQDLQAVAGKQILDARFKIYAYPHANTLPLRMYPVVPSFWSAGSMTWSNKPAHRADYLDIVPPSAAWTDVDITTWVQNWLDGTWGNSGLSMDTAGQPVKYNFAAMENGIGIGAPYIRVTYADQVTAPTGTTFTIRNGATDLVMDVPGTNSNTTDGTQIQQAPDVATTDQRWMLQPSSTVNAYLVVNSYSDKALTVMNGSMANGATIVQTTPNANDIYHQWRLFDMGNGRYSFANVGTGKVIDVPGNNNTFGVVGLQQWIHLSYATDERWLLVAQPPSGSLVSPTTNNGYFSVLNSVTGLVFDVPGADNNFANGVQIQQASDVNGGDERWNLAPVSGLTNTYQIVNNLTSKALAISNDSGSNGAAIVQTTSNASDVYQQWKFVDAGSGTMLIYNVGSGRVVDVPGNNNSFGTIALHQWEYLSYATDERWHLLGQHALEFRLEWSGNSDVDLRVAEPNGNLIYTGNPGTTASGGVFTGDSACPGAGGHVESVAWASLIPLIGAHTARVEQYNTCGGSAANWTLYVIKNNAVVTTYTGTGTSTDFIYTYTGA